MENHRCENKSSCGPLGFASCYQYPFLCKKTSKHCWFLHQRSSDVSYSDPVEIQRHHAQEQEVEMLEKVELTHHPIPSHPIPSHHLIREPAKKWLALVAAFFFAQNQHWLWGMYGLWGYTNQKLGRLLVQECQPAIKSVRQMFLAGNRDRTMRNPNDVKGGRFIQRMTSTRNLWCLCLTMVDGLSKTSQFSHGFVMVFPKIAGELTICQPEIFREVDGLDSKPAPVCTS